MHSNDRIFPFLGVVIIADLVDGETLTPLHARRDLEQTSPETLKELCAVIELLGLKAHHYSHPKILAENASKHRHDVVLSIFGGEVSRSRMALVPAVCESMGLSYIGPDAYGRVICQDKEISKTLASEAGLKTAQHRILRGASDLSKLSDFPLPYVAKPLWEGSSIGIGPDNLVRDHAAGLAVTKRLLKQFEQPVMIESFVPGREVSYCFIDGPEKAVFRSFAESVWRGDSNYFDNHLFDSSHKSKVETSQSVRCIASELASPTADALERLLEILGPVGYGRIDGRLKGDEFTFLEVTPDAWLGSSGVFINSFLQSGHSLTDIIAQILLSGRLSHQCLSASG